MSIEQYHWTVFSSLLTHNFCRYYGHDSLICGSRAGHFLSCVNTENHRICLFGITKCNKSLQSVSKPSFEHWLYIFMKLGWRFKGFDLMEECISTWLEISIGDNIGMAKQFHMPAVCQVRPNRHKNNLSRLGSSMAPNTLMGVEVVALIIRMAYRFIVWNFFYIA